MEEIQFTSFDKTIIYGYLWQPKGKAKGIVQIIHGLQEYGSRYRELALFLQENGYVVFASDQRLHGKTANGNLSKTTEEDVFPKMLKDQMLLSDMLIDRFQLPLIVLGHSFGSFETQAYIQRYGKEKMAIICGSAYMKRLDVLAGKWVSWWTKKIKGGTADARAIEKLVFENYNKRFKGNSTWLSASKENAKSYESDPLCGVPLCANFYYSMFKNVRKLYGFEAANIQKDLPLLLISGKDDPVGGMGKSVLRLAAFYRKRGLKPEVKLYEGMRHEILNEIDRHEVYHDILTFIEKNIK